MERAAILGDGKYLDVSRALGVGATDSDSLSQENHFSPGPLRDFSTAAAATTREKADRHGRLIGRRDDTAYRSCPAAHSRAH